jgi:SPP1 family holin
MNMSTNKITAGTIARTIVLVVALVNQCLTVAGKSVFPISDEQIENVVSVLFTVVTAAIAWWNNNSFTAAAIAGDSTMKEIKEAKTEEA